MSERGDRVWVLADGTWQWARYEFRITNTEPLGQHSVFLESGGGRRVLCGCKVMLAKPALPVEHAVTGAIAFLRENWRHNDGAEGESVKLVCDELERLRAAEGSHS